MQDDDTKETIDSVDYLIKVASLLPNETYAHKLLKSHLLSKSRKLLDSCGNQQRTLFSEEEVCRKCTSPWSDTNYSIGVKPIKMTKSRAKKVMQTVDDKSNRQRKAKRQLSKKANNLITVECDLCKNRKKIVLWKKSANGNEQRVERKSEPVVVKPIEPPMMVFDNASNNRSDLISKKRKHKKDRTAGLLYTINKDDKQLQKVAEARKTTLTPGKNKPKPKGGGAQKPKVKMTNVMAPSHIMKQASIFQLANALKKKNAEPTSTADKLKKMLN